jgi:hypothetical protein
MNIAKHIFEIFSGYLTVVIAITTTYIVIQQYLVSRYKVRMDLYDRRLKIYNAIMKFMRHVRQHGDASNDQIFELIEQTAESKFLFKGAIKEHIELLYQKALDLQEVNRQLADHSLPKGAERTRLAKEMTKHFQSLRDQYNQTDILFSKYLKLDE